MAKSHPLRTYRESKGLSVAALARELGVSRTAVYRWEGGEREIDRKLWASISDRTGVSVSDLAGFDRVVTGEAA